MYVDFGRPSHDLSCHFWGIIDRTSYHVVACTLVNSKRRSLRRELVQKHLYVSVGLWAGKPTWSTHKAQNQLVNPSASYTCNIYRINFQAIIVLHGLLFLFSLSFFYSI